MKGLVIVAGIQLSGKSTLCRRLESADNRFRHISIDEAAEYLPDHRAEFFRLIGRYNPSLQQQIKNLGAECGLTDEKGLLTLFALEMKRQGKWRDFEVVQGFCATIYASDQIRKLGHNGFPLIDGVLSNKHSRQMAYATLSHYLKDFADLHALEKTLVYFNLGLRNSLDRFKSTQRPLRAAMKLSERHIYETWKAQELPKQTELPNLEVLLVRKNTEIDAAYEHIVAKCR